MTYNRYSGNTGHVVRVQEPPLKNQNSHQRGSVGAVANTKPPTGKKVNRSAERVKEQNGRPVGNKEGEKAERRTPNGNMRRPPSPLEKITGGIGGILSDSGLFKTGNSIQEMEIEDLLLVAVLYLLYRESGDTEFLIILGVMLFL